MVSETSTGHRPGSSSLTQRRSAGAAAGRLSGWQSPGFHIAAHVRDDGVPVSWVTRQHTSCEPGFLEKEIGDIMQPALQAILVVCGFAAQATPEGDDDAGYILVTGPTGGLHVRS
jgi:hypothetical protein